jgi:ADP-heptose:LPS heptosyltransferase
MPDYRHVILAGIREDENPACFSRLASNYQNVNLQPAMNLDSTIQFLAHSHLVISNDTGVRNLAISVDTPTLGIFFSTVPHRYWPRGNGRHEAVFLSEGEVPSVERVTAGARRILAETAGQGR